MTPHVAALRITPRLHASEACIDTSIADLADLIGQMARARVETGTVVGEGQLPLTLAAAALLKQVEARRDVVRLHAALNRIAETADVPTDCPDKDAFTGAELDNVREAA